MHQPVFLDSEYKNTGCFCTAGNIAFDGKESMIGISKKHQRRKI